MSGRDQDEELAGVAGDAGLDDDQRAARVGDHALGTQDAVWTLPTIWLESPIPNGNRHLADRTLNADLGQSNAEMRGQGIGENGMSQSAI
jgi:hypothetical protein